MNRAALSTLIGQLGCVPSVERMAILQEILDALADRIESLERQVRSVRLQARPFRNLGPAMISAAGGKSVNRTPVKRFDTEHRNKSKV